MDFLFFFFFFFYLYCWLIYIYMCTNIRGIALGVTLKVQQPSLKRKEQAATWLFRCPSILHYSPFLLWLFDILVLVVVLTSIYFSFFFLLYSSFPASTTQNSRRALWVCPLAKHSLSQPCYMCIFIHIYIYIYRQIYIISTWQLLYSWGGRLHFFFPPLSFYIWE